MSGGDPGVSWAQHGQGRRRRRRRGRATTRSAAPKGARSSVCAEARWLRTNITVHQNPCGRCATTGGQGAGASTLPPRPYEATYVPCYTCYGWNTANGLRSGARATAAMWYVTAVRGTGTSTYLVLEAGVDCSSERTHRPGRASLERPCILCGAGANLHGHWRCPILNSLAPLPGV